MENLENNEKFKKTLKAFFVVCNSKGVTEDERRSIVSSYGYDHANKMTTEELQDAIYKLNQREDTEEGERDKWCRKAMAVTYKYLIEVANVENPSSDYVKEVITTSQRGVSFAKLTKFQLAKSFYLFKKKIEAYDEQKVSKDKA